MLSVQMDFKWSFVNDQWDSLVVSIVAIFVFFSILHNRFANFSSSDDYLL